MSSNQPQNTGEITYNQIKKLFVNTKRPVLGTGEVADAFEVTPQAALYRLNRLQDRGELERHKIQSNAVVWWLADSYESDSAMC